MIETLLYFFFVFFNTFTYSQLKTGSIMDLVVKNLNVSIF